MLGQAFLLQAVKYQTPIDQKWTTADGLPSSSISGLARTPDGLIWIATYKGLVRFDGARFDPFVAPSLPNKGLTYLTTGPDSRLYVGTQGAGLLTISREGVATFTRNDKLKRAKILIILPVGNDEAWLGTHGGSLFHYQANAVVEAGSGNLPNTPIYALARTPDGVIWIGTDEGLFQLKDNQVSRFRLRKPIPYPNISDLAVSKSGSVFAGTERGLLQIDGDRWRSWTVKDGLPSDFIKVLAAAGNDLWIGTNRGLAKLSSGVITRVGDEKCPVFALLPEQDAGVWFGCEDIGGLHRLKYPLLPPVLIPKPLASAQIYSMLEDRGGAVWIGSDQGVAKWQNDKTTLYSTNNGLPSSYVLEVSLAPDNSVWLATGDGFANIKNGRVHAFRSLPKGSADPIYSTLEDRSGTLWIGAGRGLLCLHRGETKLEGVREVNSTVWSIREDSKGNIWVATATSGLFRLSAGSVAQHYGRESGLKSENVIDSYEMSNGDIWATESAGLLRIRNGRCAHIDATNGLPAGPAFTVLEDRQGRSWIRFADGVFVSKNADMNKIFDQGFGTVPGRFLVGDDGFGDGLSDGAGKSSIFQHSSGDLWFALLTGIVATDPLKLSLQTPALAPKILHVVTDAGERDLTSQIVVKPADRNVRFSFTAPALSGAQNLDYRYRLGGFDDAWREIGNAYPVTYTALPPGKYRFEVGARRPHGTWSSASAPIQLQILPHFYQTWWWYTLMAMALLLAMSAFYALRLAVVRKQFAALMTERLDERSRLARELHDTVSRSLVGISVQLDATKMLLESNSPAVTEHLERVSQLAYQATTESRMSIFALRSRESYGLNLQQMLQQSAAAFSSTTAIQVELEMHDEIPDWSEEVKYEVIRIVEESLSNVRLHSGAKSVIISAQRETDWFGIRVRDDGGGFPATSSIASPGGHFGVVGMRERAKRIRGRVSVRSTPGAGTEVFLQLPLLADWKSKRSFWIRSIAARVLRYARLDLFRASRRTS